MSMVLEAKERTDFRRSNIKELRDNGKIPAVLYGVKRDSTSVSVDSAELLKIIRDNGRNGVISLKLNGNQCNVVLSDFQTDPIKRDIIHADFLAVDMAIEIQVNVRIQLDGEAAGVKDGGVLQQPLHEISISATPDHIPQAIHVDISNLQVAENLTIADIANDKNFTINHDEEEVVVTILPPLQEKEISTGEQQSGGVPENLEGRETKSK